MITNGIQVPREILWMIADYTPMNGVLALRQVCREHRNMLEINRVYERFLEETCSVTRGWLTEINLAWRGGDRELAACISFINTRSINLTCNPSISNQMLRVIARRCANLTHLNLNGCTQFTLETLMYLRERCQNLRELIPPGEQQMTALANSRFVVMHTRERNGKGAICNERSFLSRRQ